MEIARHANRLGLRAINVDNRKGKYALPYTIQSKDMILSSTTHRIG